MRYIAEKYGYGTALVITGIIALVLTAFAADDYTDRLTGIIAAAGCFLIGGILIAVRRKNMEKLMREQAEAEAEAERRKKSDPHYHDKISEMKAPEAYKPPVSGDAMFIIDEVFKDNEPLPVLSFTALRQDTGLWDSKLGGVPYMPKDMPYPMGRDGVYKDQPLRLLAQLNFEQLPKLEGFPERGILQFFCSCAENGSFGLDFDAQCDQNGFRVIYHRDIITDASELKSADDIPQAEGDDFPFEGEYLLTAEYAECPVSPGDFRAEKTLSVYEDGGSDDIMEEVYDTLEILYTAKNKGTCAGGYPYFTQSDPRPYCEGRDKTVLLFQLDSDMENGIMWGDCGVGNFFISPEDLEALDFSRVLYNWDCC